MPWEHSICGAHPLWLIAICRKDRIDYWKECHVAQNNTHSECTSASPHLGFSSPWILVNIVCMHLSVGFRLHELLTSEQDILQSREVSSWFHLHCKQNIYICPVGLGVTHETPVLPEWCSYVLLFYIILEYYEIIKPVLRKPFPPPINLKHVSERRLWNSPK